jgi:uncharacterized protein (TIGR02996 family)
VTEADFVAALATAPDDLDLWRVFADWLEDRDDNRAGHIRTLVRIKEILARPHAGPYRPEPCLDELDLEGWEAANGVLLPGPYRVFLRHIGNGGRMPGSYCDFVITPLVPDSIIPLLLDPFPITQEGARERRAQIQDRNWSGGLTTLFPELEPFWEEEQFPGCLMLGHYPSYDGLFLVLTGELPGTIWCTVSWGVPEKIQRNGEPHDFLTWFEDVLLELYAL